MIADPLLPVVDIAPLLRAGAPRDAAVARIARACRELGFFYVVGHGLDVALQRRLEQLSQAFFGWSVERKQALSMQRSGRAWRGYFPLGGELTSGRPDHKEGLYFGAEQGPEHPQVLAGRPFAGPNLFPPIPGFRQAVLASIDALTALGHSLMEALSLGLGLDARALHEAYTAEPIVLFRIFHYPALPAAQTPADWSVGEHTDYGFLTILTQDQTPGLQLYGLGRWIDAPPIENALLCNVGDMLERLTGGLYRSTPHRVANRSEAGRLSFPFFFDPGHDAEILPLDVSAAPRDGGRPRWDDADIHALTGTYGDYLVSKVSRVFPELADDL